MCALLVRVPLGLGPSLHWLRHGSLHSVRRLRSYYGLVRLPASVHRRLRLLAFPTRTLGHCAIGQMQDLPVSGTLLLCVMRSSTSAGRQHLAKRCCSCCVRLQRKASAPTRRVFRGSITHPAQLLCTLRGHRHLRLTQHSLPGGSLRLTWAGLSPADRASLLAPSLCLPYRRSADLLRRSAVALS